MKDTVTAVGGSANSVPLTFDSNTTVGNMIFVVVGFYTNVGGREAEISDSNGNQYTPVPFVDPSTANPRGQVPANGEFARAYYALNIKGGANTATATFSDGIGGPGSATFVSLAVTEYSGVNAFLNVDSGQVGFATGTSTSPASFAGASASGLAIGWAVSGNNHGGTIPDWTAGSGWTLRTTASARQIAIEDKIISSSAPTATFTQTVNDGWGAGVVVFYQNSSIVLVQHLDHNDGMSAPSATDVVTFNRPNLVGDFLFLNYVWVNNPAITISAVTDTAGNTWVPTTLQSMGDGIGTTSQAWYVLNCLAASSNTVTVHFSSTGASFIGMEMHEWSGVDTVDKLSITNSAGSSTNAPTTPSVTTVQTSELILPFCATQAGFQATNVPYPYVLGATQVRSVSIGSQINSPGSYQVAFTQQTSAVWSAGIITVYQGLRLSVSGSAGVAGATISWTGTSSGGTVADSSGNFNTGAILSPGTYIFTASLPAELRPELHLIYLGYTFSSSQTVVLTVANATGINFTAAQGIVLASINNPDDTVGSATVVTAHESQNLTVTAGTIHGRLDPFSIINNPG